MKTGTSSRGGGIKRLALLAILFVASVRTPSLDQSLYLGWVSRTVYAYVFVILFRYKDAIFYGRWRWALAAAAALGVGLKIFYWNAWPVIDIRSMTFDHAGRYVTFFVSFSGIALVFWVSKHSSECAVGGPLA